MKKAYYINYYRDFCNTYNLRWCWESEPAPPGEWQRITRKEAIAKCKAERQARRDDPNFSGYADAYIYPASGKYNEMRPICTDGYTIEEV